MRVTRKYRILKRQYLTQHNVGGGGYIFYGGLQGGESEEGQKKKTKKISTPSESERKMLIEGGASLVCLLK